MTAIGAWIAIGVLVLWCVLGIAAFIYARIRWKKETERLKENARRVIPLIKERFGWDTVEILKERVTEPNRLDWIEIQTIFMGFNSDGELEWAVYKESGFDRASGGWLSEPRPMERVTYLLDGPRGPREVQVWWCEAAPMSFVETQLRALYPDYECRIQLT